jgi:predicted outer membrane repeat protein
MIMAFFSRLRARMTGRSRNRRARRREPVSPFYAQAAQVETLEQRCLLSALTVTTLADSGAGSLRAEIAAAHAGDTIVFDSHLFDAGPQGIRLTSGELVVNKNLTIQGPSTGQLEISGGYSSRVFEVDGAKTSLILDDLILEEGVGIAQSGAANPSDGHGGAILNFGSLTLNDCDLLYNSAESSGGGIDNQGSLTVSGGELIYNQAGEVGGVPALGEGGGIASEAGTTKVINCDLSSNSAGLSGGGIYGGGISVSGTTLSANTAGINGGGIDSFGTLTISNSALSANTAGADGGGIYAATTVNMNGATLTDNSAQSGGGIYHMAGTLTISGSTFLTNSAVDAAAILNSYKATAIVEAGSMVHDNTATNGSIIDNAGTLTISGSTVSDNGVSPGEGAISNAKTGHLTITSSIVDNTVALLGYDIINFGALKISQDSKVGTIGP